MRSLKYRRHGLAEVLKAGASEESRAAAHSDASGSVVGRSPLGLFMAGARFCFIMRLCRLQSLEKIPQVKIFGRRLQWGLDCGEINPGLLGVGYINRPRMIRMWPVACCLSRADSGTSSFFGSALTTALPPGKVPISQMDPRCHRGAYVLYIGAGAVAAGGIISMVRSLPTIWSGLKGGLSDLRGGQAARAGMIRTDETCR